MELEQSSFFKLINQSSRFTVIEFYQVTKLLQRAIGDAEVYTFWLCLVILRTIWDGLTVTVLIPSSSSFSFLI